VERCLASPFAKATGDKCEAVVSRGTSRRNPLVNVVLCNANSATKGVADLAVFAGSIPACHRGAFKRGGDPSASRLSSVALAKGEARQRSTMSMFYSSAVIREKAALGSGEAMMGRPMTR
jgi:hypothetical protein